VQRKETGCLGEQLAKSFLQRKGYRIIETNCRCGRDEIDIVARQKDYLVFIEVRTKSSAEYGSPEESLTFDKMTHMERAALQYLQSHNMLSDPWRIDLVAVELDASSKPLRIELVENALEF
jgi:putative endonuclease